MIIFKRGKKHCLCPVSTTSASRKMLRACPLPCVKAKNVMREIQHTFTKGKLCLTNLNIYGDKMSGHAAKGTAVDTIYRDFPVAFDTIHLSQHTHEEAEARWTVGAVENWLGRQRDLKA